ncbi:MAG TPA: AsmA family protein [Acidobacteriaceae bacterium]|nr:AsmA family protein [Acidobacteriaceae bacterium]
MQESNPYHDLPAAESVSAATRRLIAVLIAVLVLLLLVLLPPFFNVSRLQRRVASNISAALGRPVHFDQITLNLLPIPGFTLQNFVVDENPAFGSDPILRASQVRANLRLRSLWSRHVEFSRISLTEASVNLVHTPDGKWNVEALLLKAAHTQTFVAPALPATQASAGPAPYLPYIEASGARLNLKLDQEKTPFSLTDADFALWLPQPHQWRLRLEAHPVRTDTSPADTGTVRVEATLGSPDAGPTSAAADSMENLPIDLQGSWQDVQLGGLSRLFAARDAGMRGELALSVNLLGTLGQNNIAADIQVSNARRADFVPPHLLSLEVGCHAIAHNTFLAFTNIECQSPPSGSSDAKLLLLTANLPDVLQLNSASAALTLPALSAETFFDWLGVATPHPPTGLTGPGTLAGNLAWGTDIQPGALSAPRSLRKEGESKSQQPGLSGELEFSHELLQLPALGSKAIPLGALLLRSTPPAARSSHQRGPSPPTQANNFDLAPISLPLGGKQPATLEGHLDASGYTLHLTGTVLLDRLLALGDAIPQLGDGLRQLLQPTPPIARSAQSQKSASVSLAVPIHIDLTATRIWGGPQTWSQTAPSPSRPAGN